MLLGATQLGPQQGTCRSGQVFAAVEDLVRFHQAVEVDQAPHPQNLQRRPELSGRLIDLLGDVERLGAVAHGPEQNRGEKARRIGNRRSQQLLDVIPSRWM